MGDVMRDVTKARQALNLFAEENGDDRSALTDLLADLQHLVKQDGWEDTFLNCLLTAEVHFNAETREKADG
jgi:hypothetical protein